MNPDVSRTRLIILGIVFLAVIAVMLYLRGNEQSTADHQAKSNEIKVAVEPACEFETAVLPAHDIVEVTYRWKVWDKFTKPLKRYKVKVHFVNDAGAVVFQDDHYPPVSVMDWSAGETIEYTRIVYVPPLTQHTELMVLMGLYDEFKPDKPIVLKGDMKYPTRYLAGAIALAPPPNLQEKLNESQVDFDDGWYPLEREGSTYKMWRWMRRRAAISLPNLDGDAMLFLDCWVPRHPYEKPTKVRILFNDKLLDELTAFDEQFFRKYRLPAAAYRGEPAGYLSFEVDQSYIPRKLGLSNDERELGLMLITAYYRRATRKQSGLLLPAKPGDLSEQQ